MTREELIAEIGHMLEDTSDAELREIYYLILESTG